MNATTWDVSVPMMPSSDCRRLRLRCSRGEEQPEERGRQGNKTGFRHASRDNPNLVSSPSSASMTIRLACRLPVPPEFAQASRMPHRDAPASDAARFDST